MNQPFRSAPQPDNASPGELEIQETFDYTPLTAEVAQQVQTAAQRIRHLVQRTMEDIFVIGQELLAVKKSLPHGHFGSWLRAEFGWTERTARRFMAVAARFGPKTDTMSDLPIEPTAAYLLAAPTAPQEAIAVAVERAQRGERITVSVAKGILGSLRKKPVRRVPSTPELSAGQVRGLLLEALESFRQRWAPQYVSLLARQLREFADSLETEQKRRRVAGEK